MTTVRNIRQQYSDSLHFVPGVPPLNYEPGPLMDTYERWLEEGLTPDLDPRRYDEWCDALGLDHFPQSISIQLPRAPLFEEIVLEETETTITKRLSDGAIQQDSKGWHRTIPHELRPAVTNRDEWARLKEWLSAGLAEPDPTDPVLVETLRCARESIYPVNLNAGSLIGVVRNWLGFENFCLLSYDDPQWLEEMLEVCCQLAEWQVRVFGENQAPIETIGFWEDICYKNGPMMNPAHFRALVTPRYRRIADLAATYGYDRMLVDSDGNISALLDAWLEGGVNVLTPLEVQAGMDINEIQQRYPGCYFIGGIHKYRLAEGEDAIRVELERIRPAVEMGGYHPHLDHLVPHDVSLQNYLAYLRLRHDILGLGQGAPPLERVMR